MAGRVGVVRRRAVLAGMLATLAAGRGAQAQPAGAAAPAPADARGIVTQLRLARALLCARCDDDIERSGVNHPARRSMMGRAGLERARDMIAAAPALPGAVPAMRQLRHGIEVLGSQEEEEAIAAIDAAILAIEAEGRVAARGGPPDPRALAGQLRLARRFLCVPCGEDDWNRGRRARARGAGSGAGDGGSGAEPAASGAGARTDDGGGAGAGRGRRPPRGCGAGARDPAVAALAAVGLARRR
jgi:hypothetical protein